VSGDAGVCTRAARFNFCEAVLIRAVERVRCRSGEIGTAAELLLCFIAPSVAVFIYCSRTEGGLAKGSEPEAQSKYCSENQKVGAVQVLPLSSTREIELTLDQ
jgi:hypothetical protein